MSDGFGQTPKKETVYSGPTPPMDNQAFGQPAASGTAGGSSNTGSAGTAVRAGVSPQVVAGASWFFWIAALSLVNSFITMSGSNWHFILGMGVTLVMDVIGAHTGSVGTVVAFVVNLVIAGIVVLFGVFARKGQKWAFLVGMVLYTCDGVLLLVFRDFLSAAFHVYALFCIFRGFKALN